MHNLPRGCRDLFNGLRLGHQSLCPVTDLFKDLFKLRGCFGMQAGGPELLLIIQNTQVVSENIQPNVKDLLVICCIIAL